MQRMNILII